MIFFGLWPISGRNFWPKAETTGKNRELFRALVDSELLDFLAAQRYDEADRVLPMCWDRIT